MVVKRQKTSLKLFIKRISDDKTWEVSLHNHLILESGNNFFIFPDLLKVVNNLVLYRLENCFKWRFNLFHFCFSFSLHCSETESFFVLH